LSYAWSDRPLPASLQKQSLYLLGQRLDKEQRMTDWGARPLTERQRAYAAADATVARDLYFALSRELACDLRVKFAKESVAQAPRQRSMSKTPGSGRVSRSPSKGTSAGKERPALVAAAAAAAAPTEG
jgi:ribonuclease D